MEDTKRLQSHMQGKLLQLDYDFILAQTGECEYCLTDAQVQMILAFVDYYGWRTRWYSESGEIDIDIIDALKGGLVDRLMSGCCSDPVLTRITSNGHYQTSNDGGTTWTDTPIADPRYGVPIYPPLLPPDTVSAKCTYADAIVHLMKDAIADRLTDGMTVSEILGVVVAALGGILAVLATTILGAIAAAIIGGVAALVVGITIPALQAALTTDVWNRLRCNIKCNIASDGEITQAALDSIYTKIGTDESGIAAMFLQQIVAAMGTEGMTNAARSGVGDPSADCSACDCGGCITGWYVGYNYAGVDQTFPTDLIEAGDNFIVVQSHDRGDGLQIIIISQPVSGGHCCSVLWSMVTEGHELSNRGSVACDVSPTYENISYNALLPTPTNACVIYMSGSGGGVFQMRFEFAAPI